MKLSELISPLDAKLIGADAQFDSVSLDTRTIKSGELYIALKGENLDGHDFIADAEEKGAVAILANHPVDTKKIPVLQVDDTMIALGKLAAWHRAKFSIPVIGLTGSCGKTTVKEMTRSILAERYCVLANVGTLNNHIGVPLTLLKLTSEHQCAVIEMGANHPGEIAYLTQMVKPTVAFINNIAAVHLEGFKTLEGVAHAKAEIFLGLDKNGSALINADDHYANWLKTQIGDRRISYFSLRNSTAENTASHITIDEVGRAKFILHTPQGDVDIRLSIYGEHNVLNAVAAAAAAQQLGASLNDIKSGLENMQSVSGRMTLREGIQGARIFDDSYNANPTSVKAAVDALAKYSGERIIILGDMGELGPEAENFHRDIGLYAKKAGIQQFFAIGKLMQHAVDAFGKGAFHFADHDSLSNAVKEILNANMTVLVKGSKSAKMGKVVEKIIQK
jgi:UDP-N-acetylmuramoyl-tripeptide--D-alanyl-D-alanine ligase